MKTERRHELQKNELADWIGHQFDRVRPHGKTILAASILGAAVIIAAMVILQDREVSQDTAWTDFHMYAGSRDSSALAELAKQHSGTQVGLWAREAQARLDLERGIASLYTNRDDAMMALNDARKGFADVVAGATSKPELLQLALFGLGEAQEAAGNLDAAREYYQQVSEKFPDTVIGKQAASRLKTLKDPKVVSFYNWFAKQKPRPSSQFSMPGMPNMQNMPGTPGLPADLHPLPDLPDLPPAPEGSPVTAPADVPTSPAPGSPPKGDSSARPSGASAEPPAPDAPGKAAPPSAAAPQPPAAPVPPNSPPPSPEGEKKSTGDSPKPDSPPKSDREPE